MPTSSLAIGNRVHNIGALVFVWKPSTAVFANFYGLAGMYHWSHSFAKQRIDDRILHFSTPEILNIIRRNCYTSQGDPDSSFSYLAGDSDWQVPSGNCGD